MMWYLLMFELVHHTHTLNFTPFLCDLCCACLCVRQVEIDYVKLAYIDIIETSAWRKEDTRLLVLDNVQ